MGLMHNLDLSGFGAIRETRIVNSGRPGYIRLIFENGIELVIPEKVYYAASFKLFHRPELPREKR